MDEEIQKLYDDIEEAAANLADEDRAEFDAQTIADSIDDLVADKKEELRLLHKLRKEVKPSLLQRIWRRIF